MSARVRAEQEAQDATGLARLCVNEGSPLCSYNGGMQVQLPGRGNLPHPTWSFELGTIGKGHTFKTFGAARS